MSAALVAVSSVSLWPLACSRSWSRACPEFFCWLRVAWRENAENVAAHSPALCSSPCSSRSRQAAVTALPSLLNPICTSIAPMAEPRPASAESAVPQRVSVVTGTHGGNAVGTLGVPALAPVPAAGLTRCVAVHPHDQGSWSCDYFHGPFPFVRRNLPQGPCRYPRLSQAEVSKCNIVDVSIIDPMRPADGSQIGRFAVLPGTGESVVPAQGLPWGMPCSFAGQAVPPMRALGGRF